MDKSKGYRALEVTALINGVSTQEVIEEISAALAVAKKDNGNSFPFDAVNLTPSQLVECIAGQVSHLVRET